MKPGGVDIYCFSGSGNSWLAAKAVADVLREDGSNVNLLPLEKCDPGGIDRSRTLGLAFPVACGTTYPLVWRFLDGLPQVEGTDVFMLDTLAGGSAGMVGPLGEKLKRKGFSLLGAAEIIMPSNFIKVDSDEKNSTCRENGLAAVQEFARGLLEGKGRWKSASAVSRLACGLSRLATGMWKFKFSKLLLRQRVNVDACTGCGICAALCPVNAIEIIDGKAQVGLACEYCQRCAAVCPEKAIRTNGRNYQPYSVANEELLKFWNNKDNTQC